MVILVLQGDSQGRFWLCLVPLKGCANSVGICTNLEQRIDAIFPSEMHSQTEKGPVVAVTAVFVRLARLIDERQPREGSLRRLQDHTRVHLEANLRERVGNEISK